MYMENILHIDELGNIYSSPEAHKICLEMCRPNTGKEIRPLKMKCQRCDATNDLIIFRENLKAMCKTCKRADMARMFGWKLT